MDALRDGDPPQIGPYALQGRLGADALGQVFLGRSLAGRPVAVKVIYPHLAADPEFRVRFARQADAARRVSGAFTAPVIDADADAPLPWLVTAYVHGPTLAAAVAAHGPLPVASVLTLAAGLAEALSAAHAAGVIHGDLTPANVLLAVDGPRLTDFGMAQAVDRAEAASSGLSPGTPGFLSPEQAEGLPAGPASDIFGLGAVLLYAATGLWMAHFIAHPDQLPDELRPFIERCMAADPADRPTATEFLTELIAAHPAAVNHDTWLPPGIVAADAGPKSHRQHQRKPVDLAGWCSKAWNQRRKLTRRHAWPLAIVALACAVVGAGVVYVIHPWPYPVLQPAGLAAGSRGVNSIGLDWASPGSGPLPDKYVILRDNVVAATVPGDVDHFENSDLTPGTTYDFRVIAYRGSARSQASANFYAATQTPPVSDGVFDSFFLVNEKIESGADSVTGDTEGETWVDEWTFVSTCAVGPCNTELSGAIDGQNFTAKLTPTGGGNYSGTAQINNYYYCGSSTTNYQQSTLYISLSAAAAHAVGNQWAAVKLSGGITWSIAAATSGDCGGGTLVLGLSG